MMKQILIFCSTLLSVYIFSQGKVSISELQKSKDLLNFEYLPEKAADQDSSGYAQFYFDTFDSGKSELKLQNGHYTFEVKPPKNAKAVIIRFMDAKTKKLKDDNDGKAYVLEISPDKAQAEFGAYKLKLYGGQFFGIQYEQAYLDQEFDRIFTQYPELQQKPEYYSIPFPKKSEDEEFRKKILAYAEQQELKGTEESLRNAFLMYRLLKDEDKTALIEKKSIEKFPKGDFARNEFLRQFYKAESMDEKYVGQKIEEYHLLFEGHDPRLENSEDYMWTALVVKAFNNNDFEQINRTLSRINEPFSALYTLNDLVWGKSGQSIDKEAKDLDFITKVSEQTVDTMAERLKNPKKNDDTDELQGIYNMFADTYALLLYKQKNYQKAFEYQNAIRLLNGLDTGGKERFAAMAEKAKGLDFAQHYIENELLVEHTNSRQLIAQLREIYKSKGLSFDQFEKLNEEGLKRATELAKEEIVKKYGSLKSMDFELTDSEGKTVKLSDYRGKLVVLDFWATWCGPCRESFPHMKELVEKYKEKNVEFFFINTWESKKPEKVKKDVEDFMSKNQYPFHVLFDFKDKVVADYKIEGIPTKIVIDRNGNIISLNDSDQNLAALIDENIES